MILLTSQPYDPKKSVWIMDPKTHGYKEGLLESGEIGTLGMEGADLSMKISELSRSQALLSQVFARLLLYATWS